MSRLLSRAQSSQDTTHAGAEGLAVIWSGHIEARVARLSLWPLYRQWGKCEGAETRSHQHGTEAQCNDAAS